MRVCAREISIFSFTILYVIEKMVDKINRSERENGNDGKLFDVPTYLTWRQ